MAARLATLPRSGPLARIGVTAGAGTALAAARLAGDGAAVGALLQCPLRTTTGIDCPGCGGTRAVHALLSGDLARAADHNVLAAVAVPLLVLALAAWWVPPLRAPLAGLGRRLVTSPVAMRALVALVVVFTVVRNTGLPLGGYLASAAGA